MIERNIDNNNTTIKISRVISMNEDKEELLSLTIKNSLLEATAIDNEIANFVSAIDKILV